MIGCGRKRSDESMAALLEMNSEPAIEELNRQILSQAKLLEAIQEARLAFLRKSSSDRQVSLKTSSLVLRVNMTKRNNFNTYFEIVVRLD